MNWLVILHRILGLPKINRLAVCRFVGTHCTLANLLQYFKNDFDLKSVLKIMLPFDLEDILKPSLQQLHKSTIKSINHQGNLACESLAVVKQRLMGPSTKY